MEQTDDRIVEVGRVGQVHGLDGTLRIHLSEGAEPVLAEGELLYLKNRRGDFIPARILEIRIEEKRNRRLFFVKFDRIADRSEAESFRDTAIYSRQPADTVASGEDSIVGFRVIDETGLVGTVTGLMKSPAHAIIEVDGDGDGDPAGLLIPWVDVYIDSVDRTGKKVICRNIEPLKRL